jgi:hypothetical protein
MIRPLRQRHRRMIFALGIFLPVAFVAGLAARRPVPTAQSLPANFKREQLHFERVVWDRADLWPQNSIRTRLLSDKPGGRGFAIELSGTKDIVKPDLIVYWSPDAPKATNSLPDTAALLGAFVQTEPTPLLLPDSAIGTTNAVFLLYSLADHEVIAISQPVTIGKP